MVEINNLSITMKQNDRPLLTNFSFSLQKGDKIAIIGEEGNGKSTLIKAIVDINLLEDYCNIKGNIIKNGYIGYLEQFLDKDWDNETVLEYFLKEYPTEELDYSKYKDIANIKINIEKVDLDQKILESGQKINTLSGGEKVKIQLAKILIKNPDVLLLDEPTNDLDIHTLEWLEDFILSANIPVLYISHDEKLLEKTANGIIHLEQIKRKSEMRYTIEHIGYKEYVEKRLGLIERQDKIAKKQRSEYKKQMNKYNEIYQKVESQQNTITRQDPHSGYLLKKKMKTLKAQEKRFDKQKENFEDIPDVEEAILFLFSDNIYIPNGKIVLDLKIKELFISEKFLSKNIELKVIGSKHIGIIGNNGTGKTTLIKKIYSLMESREDIKVGYMPQNYELGMNENMSVIDFLVPSGIKDEVTKARTFMGSMKFTPEETMGKIKNLSGGQKAKVLLLKLILEQANVLVLDEPTRNLSPLSNPIIREVLSNYTGAIISISHDRKYIENVCEEVYELTKDGLINVTSNFS